eukprot:TRINITY_DN1098_c0_g1_i1.p1 TRINITY_DN1098_c0_g1~~TRINITY_DN1098_c0_g1_i1.p1  ORF type:complete len:271 (-),score=69.53 TRINITY_DN1098_c0_g1_i1:99-911(-)
MTDTTFRDLTRATKFQRKFQLPPNFNQVLKDFTREVLRDQPSDVYAYGANYFKRLALKEEGLEEAGGQNGGGSGSGLSNADAALRNKLRDAFAEEDPHRDGRLAAHAIRKVLVGAGLANDQATFAISNSFDILNLEDPDKMIDYDAFLNHNLAFISFFDRTGHVFAPQRHKDEDSVHGLTSAELSLQLLSLCQKADTAGSGRLPIRQYFDVLKAAPLQLTHRDVALLTTEADISGDGYVLYRKEVTKAFGLLMQAQNFEAFAQEWIAAKH